MTIAVNQDVKQHIKHNNLINRLGTIHVWYITYTCMLNICMSHFPEPVPVRAVDNPFAVQRPHATQNLLLRQGSFRGFSKLQETTSPFKRTLSLRLNELPSTLQRQNAVEFSPTKGQYMREQKVLTLKSILFNPISEYILS